MWQTLLSYVRQRDKHFPKGTAAWAALRRVSERKTPQGQNLRYVLIKDCLEKRRKKERGVGEERERVRVHTRSNTTRHLYRCVTWWLTDTRKKQTWTKSPTLAISNCIWGFRRICTTSDLDLYGPGRCVWYVRTYHTANLALVSPKRLVLLCTQVVNIHSILYVRTIHTPYIPGIKHDTAGKLLFIIISN